MRCHLGLIVPDGCGITVHGKTKKWAEGKCIVFDDTYVHEAWNYGNSERTVLLPDFKKDVVKDNLDKYAEPIEWRDIIAEKIQSMRFMGYKAPGKLKRKIKAMVQKLG